MTIENTKLKDLSNNDICNYIGNALSSIGAIKVFIKKESNVGIGEYRVLYVNYKDGSSTRFSFCSERALNTEIEELKQILIHSIKHLREEQCQKKK